MMEMDLWGNNMLDTGKNIDKTVEEMHKLFSEIDTSSDEYQELDLSYLDED